jgi:hypothetical protein
MHKARHTAGQRVLDKTGQPQGRAEAARARVDADDRDEYLDWDIDQLADTLAGIDDDEEDVDESVPHVTREIPALAGTR